jgi:hypothetical protein
MVWVRMRKEENFNWNVVFPFWVRSTMGRKLGGIEFSKIWLVLLFW